MSNTVNGKEQENFNADTLSDTGLESKSSFTQEDVNRIVGERLSKERQKLEQELAKMEDELNKKEFQINAAQLLKEKHYPDTLLEALSCSDIESLQKSIGIIEKYFKIKPGFGGYKAPNPAGSFYDADAEIRSAMGINK